jgi:hypothetical protein
MMPEEVRCKARSNLGSAFRLFDAGDYDNASYLAGYVVEFFLKARYCTRKGWAAFPSDRQELKRRLKGTNEKVFSHDLDELLTLSYGATLKRSTMHAIDWDRAMDWSSEQRYAPVGSVTREQADAQLQQTDLLLVELSLYEAVEQLVRVEQRLSQTHGPFNLFAVVQGVYAPDRWDVVASAWWLAGDARANRGLLPLHAAC